MGVAGEAAIPCRFVLSHSRSKAAKKPSQSRSRPDIHSLTGRSSGLAKVAWTLGGFPTLATIQALQHSQGPGLKTRLPLTGGHNGKPRLSVAFHAHFASCGRIE